MSDKLSDSLHYSACWFITIMSSTKMSKKKIVSRKRLGDQDKSKSLPPKKVSKVVSDSEDETDLAFADPQLECDDSRLDDDDRALKAIDESRKNLDDAFSVLNI